MRAARKPCMSASESELGNSATESGKRQTVAQPKADQTSATDNEFPLVLPPSVEPSLPDEPPAETTLLQLLKAAFFTENDLLFLLVACGVSAVMLAMRHAWIEWNQPEPLQWQQNADRLIFRVDVNSADWSDWMQLDGIGRELAKRIVEDRNTNGPFLSIDDVGRVQGIGPTTLDRIRERLTIKLAVSEQ